MKRSVAVGVVCIVTLWAAARTAHALDVTFTLDTPNSVLTMSGNILGSTISAQGTGSLSTTYSGTISAQWTPGTILFTAAEADANVNGNWQPLVGGGSGSAPADYGGKVTLMVIITAYLAGRDAEFSLSSAPIALVGNNFDATQVVITTTSGSVDYRAGVLGSGTQSLVGSSGSNQAAAAGSLVVTGNDAVLTLPILYTTEFDIPGYGTGTMTVTGTLVGTAIVPEPATLALVGLGGIVALLRRR
jgi:hypothetical protein